MLTSTRSRRAMEGENAALAGNASNERAPAPPGFALDLPVALTVIYGLIFVAGILGNTSTCIVIACNRSMHTATNFYLFSLAISDLLLLVCGLPIEALSFWSPRYPLGETFCIAFALSSETSTNATVLTITVFTVERYIAICWPFMSHTMSKLSRAVRFIFAIWILALCMALPLVRQFRLALVWHGGELIHRCTVKADAVLEMQVFVISSFVFFVVPMSVISVLYALIGIKLRTSENLSVESNDRYNTNLSPHCRNGASQRRVIRMLVAVVISFFVCWVPFHMQRLLAVYGNLQHPSHSFLLVFEVITYLSGVLYYLSTAINPFLYNIMSSKFRNAFKVTLATWCGRRKGPRLGRAEGRHGDGGRKGPSTPAPAPAGHRHLPAVRCASQSAGRYQIVTLSAATFEGAIKVIEESFCQDEAVCIGSEVNKNPVAAQELLELCADAALDGVSLVAIEIASGQVVAVAFNKLQVASCDPSEKPFFVTFAEERCTQDSSRSLINFMADVDGRCNLFEKYGVDCSLEIMFLATLRDHRKKKLGELLCKCSVELAKKLRDGPIAKLTVKDLGEKYSNMPPRTSVEMIPKICQAIWTAEPTQKIGRYLNFTVHLRVPMSEFVYNGKTYADRLGGTEPFCEVAAIALD